MSRERTEVSVQFGRFVLDGGLRELRRDGRRVALQPTPMRLLWYLIRNRDRVVSGRELLERVWPGAHVTDPALAGALRLLRRALDDESHTLIQTRRGQGYRFSADVVELRDAPPQPVRCDPAARPDGPILLGREAELSSLESSLIACERGRGQVVLLRGMVGIGKTSLAEHLKERARGRGLRVHAAAWHAAGGAPPLAPWIQLLRDCARVAPDPAQRSAWLRSSDVVDPVEIRAERSLEESEESARSGAAVRGAFEVSRQVLDLLGPAARDRPRVIVLEDMHEADLDSLVVLELVSGALSELPILLLTTLREGTGSLSPTLRRALVALRRSPGYSEHRLRGLELDSIRSLLAGHSQDPPPERFVARVLELTGGNPLFVTELARLRASGQLGDVDGERIALPEAVRDALEMQIARQRPSGQHALRVASVAGSEFEIETLWKLLDVPRDGLLDLLSEAEAGGLICEVEGHPGTYTYPHPLLREVLYEGLTGVEARRWHLRTAETLETLHAGDPSPHLSRLAHHFLEAAPVGGAERAVQYARRAAEQSHRMWAFCDAAEHYRRALEVLELVADPDPQLKSDLHLAYGRELQISPLREHRAGDARAAFETAVRIAAEARSLDQLASALVDQVRVELEPLLILARSARVPAQTLERLRRQVMDALESLHGDASLARGRLRVCLAYVHFLADERPEQQHCLREAELAADRYPSMREELLVARWWFAQAPEDLPERRRLGECLHAATGRSRWLVFALAEEGELAAADAWLRVEGERNGEGLREDPDLGLWRAMRATISGRFADAESLLGDLERFDSFLARMARSLQGTWLRRLRGRSAELLRPPAEGESSLSHIFRALLHADVGRIDRAGAELRRASLDRADELLPKDQSWLFTLSLAADVMRQTGETAHAKHLYERLLPFRGRMIGSMWMLIFVGSVDRPLGQLAACQGAWDAAVTHLERALAAHEQLGALALVAQSQLDLASTLYRRGRIADLRRAEILARAAASTASTLGMGGVAEQALQLPGASTGRA